MAVVFGITGICACVSVVTVVERVLEVLITLAVVLEGDHVLLVPMQFEVVPTERPRDSVLVSVTALLTFWRFMELPSTLATLVVPLAVRVDEGVGTIVGASLLFVLITHRSILR